MSRYIDVDELLTRLPDDLPYKASVKRVLMQAPTADVAPIADTVRKMQDELKKTFSALCKGEMGDLYRIIDHIADEIIGETNDHS